jgi:hypothetical protein
MELVEIFKVINTPSRSRPALVKKVNDYLLNLIGAGTGEEDYQENIFLLGSVFGKKVVSAQMRTISELLDTAMGVDDLLLVLDFPDYKILNWIVTPIESLVGVE